MMKKILLLAGLFLLAAAQPPPLTGPELVQKSIAYHDPQGKWPTLRTRLFFQSTTAAGKASTFEVELDNATGYFCHISHPGGREVVKGVVNGQEVFLLDGQPNPSDEDRKKFRLAAGAAQGARNFYTYLYGLPMKLRDTGTRVAEEVPMQPLLGKTYPAVQVSYDPAVGQDTWSFYLDPRTYALQAYRFYQHKEPNDGEYVLLNQVLSVEGIQLPKERKWYLNKDESFLATDLLLKAEPLTTRRLQTTEPAGATKK
ncbi:hypothetical protein SAMN00120144_0252 [Hymenobacter roseosalivarius DSM 11622]|uniref:Uncharacterized protein n=1 Tax=Hymenobacter roseosalivarius DSM 11622 TaxID=645990 RepID=A0A1W1W1N2_9BACT|nr:DUF6503 family protein [Hymenobacter roseosalivarius]SMB99542.1 hypothetical protein SAMN00120144_0252 [Hymenobacter roseosalivarius DSM 11622]